MARVQKKMGVAPVATLESVWESGYCTLVRLIETFIGMEKVGGPRLLKSTPYQIDKGVEGKS